jgi:hypothetical protein
MTMPSVSRLGISRLYLTAETQRAQRKNFYIKKLCALCVSAVKSFQTLH